jgi:hypothetical protein
MKNAEYDQPSTGHPFNVVTLLYDGATDNVNSCGPKPIAAMHGYHPDDKDSVAAFMANVADLTPPAHVSDMYALMRAEVGAQS